MCCGDDVFVLTRCRWVFHAAGLVSKRAVSEHSGHLPLRVPWRLWAHSRWQTVCRYGHATFHYFMCIWLWYVSFMVYSLCIPFSPQILMSVQWIRARAVQEPVWTWTAPTGVSAHPATICMRKPVKVKQPKASEFCSRKNIKQGIAGVIEYSICTLEWISPQAIQRTLNTYIQHTHTHTNTHTWHI